MSKLEQARKILQSQIGWIELDIEFDLSLWKKESESIRNRLVLHREGDGHDGWRSCCLHGLGVSYTGTNMNASLDEYHWTELVEDCPNITKFWKSFPTERFARLRFMELSAGGKVSAHNDAPNGIKNTEFNMMDHIIPVNVAITHPDDCFMNLETYGRVPWKPGKAFVVNITDTHSVINNSNQNRMHMIAHCVLGSKKEEFAELIVRSYNKNHAS